MSNGVNVAKVVSLAVSHLAGGKDPVQTKNDPLADARNQVRFSFYPVVKPNDHVFPGCDQVVKRKYHVVHRRNHVVKRYEHVVAAQTMGRIAATTW